VGAHFAYPDIDLAQYGENSAAMRDIADASSLPVLVDAGYEAMGAARREDPGGVRGSP
jgi:2-methylisocitrate lyase-like PEP mutase family enzyme